MEFNPENITALFLLALVVGWLLKVFTAQMISYGEKLSQVAEAYAGMARSVAQLAASSDQSEIRATLQSILSCVTRIESSSKG